MQGFFFSFVYKKIFFHKRGTHFYWEVIMQKFYLIPTWEEGRNMLEKVKSVPSLQDEERATKVGMGHSNKWDSVKANSMVRHSLARGAGEGRRPAFSTAGTESHRLGRGEGWEMVRMMRLGTWGWGSIYSMLNNVNKYKCIFYLFLAALGLRCCLRAFSSCREWGLLFVVVCGFLIAVASLLAEHGL